MIVEWVIRLGKMLFDVIMVLLGVLPDMHPKVIEAVDIVFGYMFDAVSLVALFIDFDMVKILIPLVIAVLNFDHIYTFVLWVIKKIPILDIK